MTPGMDVQAAFDRAVQLHRGGELTEAASLYAKLLTDSPAYLGAIEGLAQIRFQTGDARGASELLRRAVAIEPGSWAFHANLGGALAAQGLFDEAIGELQHALGLKRDSPDIRMNLARMLSRAGGAQVSAGNVKGGIENFRQAIVLQPGFVEPYIELANTLMTERRFAEAVEPYRRTIELRPNSPEAFNNLGVALWSIEGPSAALHVYREGIAFAEGRGIDEMALGMSASSRDPLLDVGSFEEILEAADGIAARLEAAGNMQDLLQVRWTQARVRTLRGEAHQVSSLMEWAVGSALGSGTPEWIAPTLATAAMVRVASNDHEGATDLLEQADRTPHVRETPYYPAYLPTMVRAAVQAGVVPLAEHLAGGFEPVYPYQEHALSSAQAILAEARGSPERAVERYGEAARRWESFGVVPERAFALLGRGRCLVGLHRTAEAGRSLREALHAFGALGARPYVEETNRLLEEATALSS